MNVSLKRARTLATLTVAAVAVSSVATPHVASAGPVSSVPVPEVAVLTGATPPSPAGVDGVSAAVLAAAGYEQREFTLSGNARAFRFTAPPDADGRWSVAAEADTAAYRTRVVVWTPKDSRRFSGSVIAEWNNVSRGQDAAVDLKYAHNAQFRAGHAILGISAQFGGVEAAKQNAPGRYASLVHPGDSYSYDIYSQAAAAIRSKSATLLGGLRPQKVIADGESQSAGRLTTYVNAIAPVSRIFDGFLVHSRAVGAFPLQQPTATSNVITPTGVQNVPDGNAGRTLQAVPDVVRQRTDQPWPIMIVQTESDVYGPPAGVLGYGPATQPDTAKFRLWEIAGAAHIDDYVINRAIDDNGSVAAAKGQFNAMLNPPDNIFGSVCAALPNTGQHNYVFTAALDHFVRWVRTGIAPPSAPLFEGQAPFQTTIPAPVRDANGNIKGGIRTPAVDVPVATLNGALNDPRACLLAGSTAPFDAAKLKSLYPTHQAFVKEYAKAVAKQVAAGFLLPIDAATLLAAAAAAPVPGN